MKGNLVLKLAGKTKSKSKPKILNVTFLDTFCTSSRKNGAKGCLCLNISYFTYFWYSLCRKLTKILALHVWGNIHACNDLSVLIHHSFVRPFCGSLKSPSFSSLYKTPKRGLICKIKRLLLKVWIRVSYQVWFCWQISNECTLWLA